MLGLDIKFLIAFLKAFRKAADSSHRQSYRILIGVLSAQWFPTKFLMQSVVT